MGLWGFIMDQYEYMGVYGVLWESMDQCECTSIYEYTMEVCACLWESMGFMRIYEGFWESIDKYEYLSIHGSL